MVATLNAERVGISPASRTIRRVSPTRTRSIAGGSLASSSRARLPLSTVSLSGAGIRAGVLHAARASMASMRRVRFMREHFL